MMGIGAENLHLKKLSILLVFVTLISTGCKAFQAGGSELPLPSQWKLESYGEISAQTPVVAGSTATLELNENGLASGNGGCNSYGSNYEMQDKTITFKEVVSTLMACADDKTMQQEAEYFQALQAASEYKVSDKHLTILYDDGRKALIFIRQ
ncbi:MAG: META domain-containing protein [Acidobacteriaceae bacterium]